MRNAVCAALAGVLAVVGTEAEAQRSEPRRFTVTPTIGTIMYDWTSGLSTRNPNDAGVWDEKKLNPTLGVTANYSVVEQVGVGFYFEASRPTTRGDYYPALLLRFGNDVLLKTVSQRVTVMMYGIQGQFGMDIGRLRPYLAGGLGAVTVNMDPQQNDENAAFSNRSAQFGGGLGLNLGGGVLMLDFRDFMVFGWDRDKLYPVREFVGTSTGYQNVTFPTANATPPEKKKTIHNGRFAIGFSFVPRIGSTTTTDEDDQE